MERAVKANLWLTMVQLALILVPAVVFLGVFVAVLVWLL